MAKRAGGFGGGMPGNMSQLMKQAQKMQSQLKEQQESMETMEFSASSGGGVVKVTVSGKKEITKVEIDKEALDPEDVEILCDMIMAATNEALKQCDVLQQEQMSKITGGLGGLSGGLF